MYNPWCSYNHGNYFTLRMQVTSYICALFNFKITWARNSIELFWSCLSVRLSVCRSVFLSANVLQHRFFLQNYWTNFNYFFCKNIQRKILFSKINRPEKPYVVKEHSQKVNIQVCTNPDTPWYVGANGGWGERGWKTILLSNIYGEILKILKILKNLKNFLKNQSARKKCTLCGSIMRKC